MKNPWTRKNPFLSMWLSAAHTTMNRARAQGTAAARREVNKAATAAVTEGTKQVMDFWTRALTPTAKPRRARKRR